MLRTKISSQMRMISQIGNHVVRFVFWILTVRFTWQHGYGGFVVSKSNIAAMVRYIQNQERRHRRMTFGEEFIALKKSNTIRATFSDDVPRLRRWDLARARSSVASVNS